MRFKNVFLVSELKKIVRNLINFNDYLVIIVAVVKMSRFY